MELPGRRLSRRSSHSICTASSLQTSPPAGQGSREPVCSSNAGLRSHCCPLADFLSHCPADFRLGLVTSTSYVPSREMKMAEKSTFISGGRVIIHHSSMKEKVCVLTELLLCLRGSGDKTNKTKKVMVSVSPETGRWREQEKNQQLPALSRQQL